MKFILWLAIIFLIIAWIARGKKSVQRSAAEHRPQNPPRGLQMPEAMLQCATCGVHIPASEALIQAPDKAFCSEEHRSRIFPS